MSPHSTVILRRWSFWKRGSAMTALQLMASGFVTEFPLDAHLASGALAARPVARE